jgi:hypothetical protein
MVKLSSVYWYTLSNPCPSQLVVGGSSQPTNGSTPIEKVFLPMLLAFSLQIYPSLIPDMEQFLWTPSPPAAAELNLF